MRRGLEMRRSAAARATRSPPPRRQRKPMRDIFEDIFQDEPIDPVAAARRHMRPPLARRFYDEASIAEGDGGFGLLLDRRPVQTPARPALAAHQRAFAESLADQWCEQGEK